MQRLVGALGSLPAAAEPGAATTPQWFSRASRNLGKAPSCWQPASPGSLNAIKLEWVFPPSTPPTRPLLLLLLLGILPLDKTNRAALRGLRQVAGTWAPRSSRWKWQRLCKGERAISWIIKELIPQHIHFRNRGRTQPEVCCTSILHRSIIP